MNDGNLEITDYYLKDLKPHPSNEKIPPLPDAELAALAEKMRVRQEHPIVILPDGTILGGHQRVRAAKLLGWEKIRCQVRKDLEEAGEYEIEKFLFSDNL